MKRFILKLIVLSAVILTIQSFMPLPKELQAKIQEIESIFQLKPDVIYFGDSTLTWTAPSDTVKSSIPDLLETLLPGVVVVKVVHKAYQMDIYKDKFHFFIRKGLCPRYAVFPINLRSFSPFWERYHWYQFEDEVSLLNSLLQGWIQFYKPLTVFKLNSQRVSSYDYFHTKVYVGDMEVGRIQDYDNPDYLVPSDDNMGRQLAIRYMYPLSEDHRFIRALRDIARMSKEAGIEPIFYITPIDYQSGVRYVGTGFIDQVERNVAFIQSVLLSEGVQALDLSRSLKTNDFSWPEDDHVVYPNEHLKARGRTFVAENLHQSTRLKDLP